MRPYNPYTARARRVLFGLQLVFIAAFWGLILSAKPKKERIELSRDTERRETFRKPVAIHKRDE